MNRFFNGFLIAALASPTITGVAAVTQSTRHSEAANGFDGELVADDLLAGLIATEILPGDNGWHPAAPGSQPPDFSLHPEALPAFTDGAGALSGLTGLLKR